MKLKTTMSTCAKNLIGQTSDYSFASLIQVTNTFTIVTIYLLEKVEVELPFSTLKSI